ADARADELVAKAHRTTQVRYFSAEVNGLDIFYRDAGPRQAPVVVLLHGFPTSSHMYRELIPQLATRYRVIAPDYPGFGQSSAPSHLEYEYTFDNLTRAVDGLLASLDISRYTLYTFDYGAPIGYRLAMMHPERVMALLVQNGNAYEEGLQEFWDQFRRYWNEPTSANREALRPLLELETTIFQYVDGVPDTSLISPDTWTLDQARLDRPGNQEIQLDLFLNYETNVELYPAFQQYFRDFQPPTLIVWGANDFIFPVEGALAFQRDLPDAELHLLNTGHFALETDGELIADLIHRFLARHVSPQQ
ncbi:MAG: alpha/beta hydrolase, partial [Candidatus Entotheonella gemina]